MIIDNANDSYVFFPQEVEDNSNTVQDTQHPLSFYIPQSEHSAVLITLRNSMELILQEPRITKRQYASLMRHLYRRQKLLAQYMTWAASATPQPCAAPQEPVRDTCTFSSSNYLLRSSHQRESVNTSSAL